MVKPTQEQLSILYPNMNVDYISEHIDRKLALIALEENLMSDVDKILDNFRIHIFGILSMPVSHDKINLLNVNLADLEYQLINIRIESLIQMYETSGFLYEAILDKHFTPEIQKEYGGEQELSSVSRKKLLKQDIKDLLTKTMTRGRTSNATSFQTFSQGMQTFAGSDEVDYIAYSSLFESYGNTVKDITQSAIQQSVYDAESGTTIYVSDNFDIVYYRVEVLDTHICLSCMDLDGTINDMPIGLAHKNCRGIDIVLLRDINTGKYHDTTGAGYGHKLKTKTFDKKFESLSTKQKKRILGKSNYELYSGGKLSPEDFLSYNRQITNEEAKVKIDIRKMRKDINTPQKATIISNSIDELFKKELKDMTPQELLSYEKALGIKKQLYENVPHKAFSDSKPLQSYIDDIDAKYDEIHNIKTTKGVK